jgi:hypothetical protein
MLPILRILPVGGVLLAIAILVLALIPPDGSRRDWSASAVSARGALLKMGEHPEWRQFLIQAAIQRADELSRLRDLADTPAAPEKALGAGEVPDTGAGKVAGRIAGLPAERSDADPDPEDITGTIADVPAVTMPVEIGETSSTELVVAPREEKPPVTTMPKRVRTLKLKRPKIAPKIRRAKSPAGRPSVATAKSEPAAQPNLFEVIFGASQSKQKTTSDAQGSQPAASPRQINR